MVGVSVAECSASFCTFHFHPMFGGRGAEVYAMTVTFKEKGKLDERNNWIRLAFQL